MNWFLALFLFQTFFFASTWADDQAVAPTASSAPVVAPVVAPAPVVAAPAGSPSEAPTGVTPTSPAATPAKGEEADGEYEIDYEEEPAGDDGEMEAPAPKVSKRSGKATRAGGGGPAVQGSRAKHRFEPILKSETKSVYKKDGKPLDVDTD